MKDIIQIKNQRPFGAEGRVCINYTDPITHKVNEQIKGKNHVFADAWFQHPAWWDMLGSVRLVMTDSTREIDENFPYLLGNPVGYGSIGALGSGTYKGAWNTTYSFLQSVSASGVSSKLAFDFTPLQVPSPVKSIGLTEQYDNARRTFFVRKSNVNWNNYGTPSTAGASDGTYFYSIASGVVMKRHLKSRIATTIDISSIVGTVNLKIGCNQSNGRLYVRKFDGTTPGNRSMYEFSDGTFGNLLNIYSTSNDNRSENFYVYGNSAYAIVSYNTIVKSDFVSNTAPVVFTVNTADILDIGGYTYFSSVGCSGKYLAHATSDTRYGQSGIIFDMSTDELAGRLGYWGSYKWYNGYGGSPLVGSEFGALVEYPMDVYNGTNNFPCAAIAIAAYKLPVDAPDRPPGYGMTVTYEVEVYC